MNYQKKYKKNRVLEKERERERERDREVDF
jgi:hypothetical protein